MSLNVDFGRVRLRLEVRLNEEMAPPKGGLRRNLSAAEMEMLGLGMDWLIGQGYVDLTPLLLGTWEEVWENDWQRWASTMTAGGGGSRRRTSADNDCNSGDGRRWWEEAASLKVRYLLLLYPTTTISRRSYRIDRGIRNS